MKTKARCAQCGITIYYMCELVFVPSKYNYLVYVDSEQIWFKFYLVM